VVFIIDWLEIEIYLLVFSYRTHSENISPYYMFCLQIVVS